MTPIEIMALIIAVIAGIKILVLLVKPRAWFDNIVKPIYSKPALTSVIALILAGFVLKYLLNSGLTIIQIFAVMLFFALIMALSFAAYSKEMLEWAEKMLEDKAIIKRAWLAILVWIVLVIWVLYSLFA